MTLVEFLLKRIAEDEATARAATAGPWWYDPTKVNSVSRDESVFAGSRGLSATTVASTGPCDDPPSMRDAAHIARHDPARVLAECEAKRRIVEALGSHQMAECHCDDDPKCDGWKCSLCSRRWPCESHIALESLAAVFADHPDYDEAWRL